MCKHANKYKQGLLETLINLNASCYFEGNIHNMDLRNSVSDHNKDPYIISAAAL